MRTPHRLHLPAISLCALAFLAIGPAAAETTATSRSVTAVARQPLRFESLDRGLLARGSGYAMMLSPGSAAVSLSGTATVVRMTWPGADQRVQPVGEEPAAGTTNYLIGSDPSRWRRGVPSFARVRYRGLYPAIDLVFYGNQERLEYDFVVSPGGDPRDIRLRFSGEDAVRIDAQGNLVIRAGATDIVQRAPVIYQEHDGTRRPVQGRYVKASRHEVGFSVADYDRANTLYIDPVLTFSSFFGGNANNFAKAVAVDSAGNAYVTGYTESTNFPTTAGVYGTSCATCALSNNDVFVTKISPTGVLVYSTYVGGADTDDKGYAIAVDSAGNAYVTGETAYSGSGPAFPVVGGFTITAGGGAFLFKLNSTGSSLLYSTHMESGSSAVGYGVAVEGSNAYVAGVTVANDSFPLWPTLGTFSGYIGALPVGTYQAFIMKINTSAVGLASLTWATRFGGSDWNFAYAVAVNSAGQAYVTGYTTSFDFPTIKGAAQPGCGSDGNCNTRVADAFVSKFNAAGNGLLYSTFAGGSNTDTGYGIAIDASGNAYVAGVTYSPDFFTTVGAFDRTCGDNSLCDTGNDAFALKLSPLGTSFVYSTFLGGGSTEAARAIAVDSNGYSYVAGHTESVDFPTFGAIQPAGAGDAFVSVINPAGSALAYSSYLGGAASGGDDAFGIALDPAGNVWLVGQTDSADFPVKPGAISITHGAGNFDGFVVKIGDALSLTAVIPSSGGTTAGPVRLTGTGFMAGAAVTFGGVAATSISVVSPTTITAVRPAHALGTVDVVVTSLDGQVATLAGAFTYVSVPALTFTNNPLQAGVTPVKAVHLTELRAAVSTLRTRYALSAPTWPSGAITPGTVIKAAHLTELRSALADVYTAASLAVPTWSPATVAGGTTVITAAQITQVRAATLAMW
jgi:Beta-propeller repeat/IPT/TIG domain